jgi:Ca2+-binding RTX toxin-like protein
VLPDFSEIETLTLTGTTAINGTGNQYGNIIRGNAAANSLDGADGDDRLLGGAGNDTLIGGAGYDRMYGGTGDDSYTVTDATDFAYENDGEGTDQVTASVSHQLRANVENLRLIGTDNLIGEGNAQANEIIGNSGNNKLYGYDGDDTLFGGSGDDYLLGGTGNDTLQGGGGYDRMYGGTGDDTYIVTDTTNYAYENAGEGTDRVIANMSHELRANIEELELSEYAGHARGYGNAENNLILGNSGNNLLYGRDGNDTLKGGSGNDIVYGENGNDSLDGGVGQDRFYGGAGADDFDFGDGDFAGMTSGTADRIHDFSRLDGDTIDLSAVDANSNLFGDQGFTFVGNGVFTGVAGQLRYQQISGNTYVQGDVDGDGDADFWIRLDGLHDLQVGDFVI